MSALLLVGAFAVIVAVVARVTWRRADERHSIRDYRSALETLGQLTDYNSSGARQSESATHSRQSTLIDVRPHLHPDMHRGHRLLEPWKLPSGRVSSGRRPSRPAAVTGAAAISVAAAMGLALAFMPSRPTQPQATQHSRSRPPQLPATAAAGGNGTSGSLLPTASSSFRATYQLPYATYSLTIQAVGPCWVMVREDSTGKVLWTGTILGGQTQLVEASTTVDVTLGAAQNVNLSVNDQPIVLPRGFQSPFSAVLSSA